MRLSAAAETPSCLRKIICNAEWPAALGAIVSAQQSFELFRLSLLVEQKEMQDAIIKPA